MKKSIFISLLTACLLWINSPTTFANSTNDTMYSASGGNVSAYFNHTTKNIELKMFVEGRTERVTVLIIDKNKNAVYSEIFSVNSNGMEVDIPSEILGEGVFQLQVTGLSISYRNIYKFK